ncbi:hypothetical protein POVCU2_0018300 [Plasmodium ovale curtisi]|uniref:Uncharacterized protein n=1 Tax=Plasmodium ovale curtisi TaxID=864141 RepID=A0A1A8VTI2_PLAOA|nr:hypothetical protein POVCU2_0018300 [Plasmodium ovale curtisi]SBS89452.1 hypothetical protein POVCU1_016590 [Plasmodium ovale curtisi]
MSEFDESKLNKRQPCKHLCDDNKVRRSIGTWLCKERSETVPTQGCVKPLSEEENGAELCKTCSETANGAGTFFNFLTHSVEEHVTLQTRCYGCMGIMSVIFARLKIFSRKAVRLWMELCDQVESSDLGIP